MESVGNIFSNFDGCSCGQLALVRAGIVYDNYYATEIDKRAIAVTQKNFPDTIQLGDIRNVSSKTLPKIGLMIGGSPCTDLSVLGKKKGMVTTNNYALTNLDDYMDLKEKGFQFEGESYLFWEYVRLFKELGPDLHLLENVKMKKMWEKIITNALEIEPVLINSSLVSAQNRERLYWSNIPISVPDNRGILFSDIIPGAISAGKRGKKSGDHYIYPLTMRKDGKANCVVTVPHTTNCYIDQNGEYKRITPEVAEILQTMPVNYTSLDGISLSARHRMIGNGWTIDAVAHIFNGLKNV